MAGGKGVVVGQHREQHGQAEVGVVHAALLAALTMHRVDRLPRRQRGHHAALAGDDPEEHVGAHRRGHHRAHQQEGRAPGKPVAGQVRRRHHHAGHDQPDQAVAAGPLPQRAADEVVDQPEADEHRQGRPHRRRRRPGMHRSVDQEGARLKQIQHGEQPEAGEPGGVALPVEPVQMRRQARRRPGELDGVIEAPAVHGPQLAAHALQLEGRVVGRGEAVVQPHEVERGPDPGDRHHHMRPAQQQVGPVQQIGFHRCARRGAALSCRGRWSRPRG